MLNLNKLFRQSSFLYISMIMSVVLGFAISVINTKILTVDEFGVFKYLQIIGALIGIVFSFGIPYTFSRMIAIKDESIYANDFLRSILNHLFFTSFIISILGLLLSYIFHVYFNSDISIYLAIMSIFFFVPLANMLIDYFLQATNKIYLLGFFRLGPKLVYIGSIFFTIYLFKFEINDIWTISISFLSFAVFIFIFYPWKNAIKENDLDYIPDIVIENKKLGMPIYLGTLFGTGLEKSIGIYLGIITNMIDVAFFSLAGVISLPLQLLPVTISVSMYKSSFKMVAIPIKIILIVLMLSSLALIIYLALIKFVINFAYGDKYSDVIILAQLLGIAFTLHGLGDFFGKYLLAKGKGSQLKRSAFISGMVIFFVGIWIIPLYSAMGAVITKLFGSLVYMLSNVYYYKVNIIE